MFFLALNDILLTLGQTKIINSNLYEQKNHFSYLVSVADDGHFSCHCAAESRHDLHLPIRSAEGHVGSYNIVVFLTICISYANNCFTL